MRGIQQGVLRQQWVLLSLIGLMVIIFVMQEIAGPLSYMSYMAVPGKITEAWENLRAGEFTGMDAWNFGTMLSCSFLHGGGDHIMMNMLMLWIFAALTVELLGHWWMLIIYVFTAFTGSLCHVIFNPHDYTPMLGASGAVMGFEGAYLGMAVRWALPNPHIWPIARPIPPLHLGILAGVAVFIDWYSVMGGVESGTAFGAHLGGFIGGLFLTSFIVRKPRMAQVRP